MTMDDVVSRALERWAEETDDVDDELAMTETLGGDLLLCPVGAVVGESVNMDTGEQGIAVSTDEWLTSDTYVEGKEVR